MVASVSLKQSDFKALFSALLEPAKSAAVDSTIHSPPEHIISVTTDKSFV